jgi:hypothetical protein
VTRRNLSAKSWRTCSRPSRKVDSDEAMKLIEANGFDRLSMAFYKNEDIGNDGVWDVWQIEGPGDGLVLPRLPPCPRLGKCAGESVNRAG